MRAVTERQRISERINVLVIKHKEGTASYIDDRNLAQLLNTRIAHIQGLIKLPDTVLVDREDMQAVGMLAAMRAMSRWKKDGADFLTFAFGRIRGAMFDYLREIDQMPRPIRVQLAKIHKSSSRVEQAHGAVYLQEVAEDTGYDVDSIRRAVLMSQARFQLPIHETKQDGDEDDKIPILGTIPVNDSKMNLLAKDLEMALCKLPKREQTIIRDLYLRDMSQRDIARRNDLTEARISQIRQTCLDRLKSDLEDMVRDRICAAS